MNTLTFEDLTIAVRESARRKTLELSIEGDGSVTLAAPVGVPEAELLAFIEEHSLRLYTKLAEKARQTPARRRSTSRASSTWGAATGSSWSRRTGGDRRIAGGRCTSTGAWPCFHRRCSSMWWCMSWYIWWSAITARTSGRGWSASCRITPPAGSGWRRRARRMMCDPGAFYLN